MRWLTTTGNWPWGTWRTCRRNFIPHLSLENLGIFPNQQEAAAGEKISELPAVAPATGKQKRLGLDEVFYRDILEDILNLQERWNLGEKIGFAVRQLPKAVQKTQQNSLKTTEWTFWRGRSPEHRPSDNLRPKVVATIKAAEEIFRNWSERLSKIDWFKVWIRPGWCIHEEQKLHRTWKEQTTVNDQSEEESVTCYSIFNITEKCFINATRM